MKNTLMMFTVILSLAAAPLAAFAQSTPIGKWKTVDDKTGKAKSIVEIYEAKGGTLGGKVDKVLWSEHGPNPVCKACSGARKDKPVEGMVILWNVKKDGDVWADGKILDPNNGKEYSVKLTPSADGSKMEVRGFLGFSLLGRSQTWTREP